MNAVVFLADGFEEVEALTPVDYLRRAGVSVELVAVYSADKNPLLVTSSHSVRVVADVTLTEYLLRAQIPDCIFFPGGMPGSKNLAANQALLEHAVTVAGQGKIVAAICAAPVVVLGKAGLLKGKQYVCYPGMDAEIPQFCGADWAEHTKGCALHADSPFVTDGTIVTGRGAGAAEEFAMELVRLLCGAEKARAVHDATCQR